jgi:hypothetical protein
VPAQLHAQLIRGARKLSIHESVLLESMLRAPALALRVTRKFSILLNWSARSTLQSEIQFKTLEKAGEISFVFRIFREF